MKQLLWVIALSLFMNCNNSTTTSQPNDLDHTDVDDSTSAHANVLKDSLQKTDSITLDSLK